MRCVRAHVWLVLLAYIGHGVAHVRRFCRIGTHNLLAFGKHTASATTSLINSQRRLRSSW